MFSTGADLTVIGQSILNNKLLSAPVTRQWMKPVTHTSDLRFTAGMPWEIQRIHVDAPVLKAPPKGSKAKTSSRLTDLYTKNGGTNTYYCQFVLSPDHDVGFVVNIAGPTPLNGGPDDKMAIMQLINRMVTEALVPSMEMTALEQATANFAGTYITNDNDGIPMEITIEGGDGRLGLGILNWTSTSTSSHGHRHEEDLLVNYWAAYNLVLPVNASLTGRPSLRLYPTGLSSKTQVAFRGVWSAWQESNVYSADDTAAFTRACVAWGQVGEPTYGNVGLDDFVFDVDEHGVATAITARGVRRKLVRKGGYKDI